uniref:C2H2-type domain-containing protein n=1 Tax=Sinocyclocheilus grahami TaxID=75366 RepID=A0A672N6L7_SINGR
MNSKDSAIPRKDIDRLCCAKCRFSTKDTDLFERHVSHHEEVTFSCALCSYVSYSKTESQKHVVLHTGSYPYRCSFCSYGAVRRDYMVKHILRIHKRNAEEGFITDFAVSTLDTAGPSVPDALGISDCHSLGNTPQVVLRSREANSNLSNAQFRADGRNKVVSSRTVSEKLIPKAMFPRVHVSSTEPLQQSLRVGVPEKAMPLTVSCPEEINIPAGCLVELVEVKNVNGTRELELRLIPPNGIPQDKKSNMDEPSSAATGGKLSFKCQVAKGCPVSPSTSTKDPEIIRLEGPDLSSESLPVISSVFSLCPTPKSTQSISKSSPEMQRWKVATKEPKDEVKNAEQSLVCSILIKKEETEDKPKGTSLGLKETKTEDETSEGSAISKTRVQVKTSGKTLNKCHSKQDPLAIKLILKRNLCEREEKHQDSPPRKKHKKEKRKAKKRRSSSVGMGLPRFSTEDQELRLTPLKADQRIKLPGLNQPVVVLNHPNPSVQSISFAYMDSVFYSTHSHTLAVQVCTSNIMFLL